MVYTFFNSKSSVSGTDTFLASKSAFGPNYQLANKLHQQIFRKFKRRKVHLLETIFGVLI